MGRIPSLDVPVHAGLAIQLPASTSLDITIELKGDDEVTNFVNIIQQDIAQSLSQSLGQFLKGELTEQIGTFKTDMIKEFKAVGDEIRALRDEVKAVKDNLTNQIDTFETDLTKQIKDEVQTFKDDYMNQIDTAKISQTRSTKC